MKDAKGLVGIESLPRFLSGSDVMLAEEADLDDDGNFCSQWFVISSKKVTLYDNNGAVLRQMSWGNLQGVSLDSDFGGGHLLFQYEGEGDDAEEVFVRFSVQATKGFAYAASVLEALISGQSVPAARLGDHLPMCPTCGRALAAGSEVCPDCLDKSRVLNRLLDFRRYFWRNSETINTQGFQTPLCVRYDCLDKPAGVVENL